MQSEACVCVCVRMHSQELRVEWGVRVSAVYKMTTVSDGVHFCALRHGE